MNARVGFWQHSAETYCESVSLTRIAEEIGTPVYVYSAAQLERNCRSLTAAFSAYPTLPCFAVKANSNPVLLKRIFEAGFGADVVSGGELRIALAAGARADQIVFSGVGKLESEIQLALQSKILSFHVESAEELDRLAALAQRGATVAPISFRINPNIDPKTDPKITTALYETKFGIPEPEARGLVEKVLRNPYLKLVGLSCHLGSQITDRDVFGEAAARMSQLAQEVMALGAKLSFLDLGGGVGVSYRGEKTIALEDYARTLLGPLRKTGLKLLIEPGRVVAATTGALLTRVIGRKRTPAKQFVIVDAGMNDLLRPALYGAFHRIEPVATREMPPEKVDVVGPICETTDCFAADRELPMLTAGDLVLIRDAGAYGFSMASTYNSRPLPAEVLVDGSSFRIIRASAPLV
jgi:diaminopimelate decarboxylase